MPASSASHHHALATGHAPQIQTHYPLTTMRRDYLIGHLEQSPSLNFQYQHQHQHAYPPYQTQAQQNSSRFNSLRLNDLSRQRRDFEFEYKQNNHVQNQNQNEFYMCDNIEGRGRWACDDVQAEMQTQAHYTSGEAGNWVTFTSNNL